MMKSMRLILAGAACAALSLIAVTTTADAQQAAGNDLRDIRVGMAVSDLPAAGSWVRLEVPASAVGLEGKSATGMGFTLFDGRASWDRAGKMSAR